MDMLPIAVLLVCVGNLVFTLLMMKRVQNKTSNTLEGLKTTLTDGLIKIDTDLKPVINGNSRAMGAISGLADSTKMDKALERRIGQDMMAQNEDVVEMIRMAFPRVAEYIDDHPDAVIKLLPRLETLISDPETRKRLQFTPNMQKSDVSRIWNSE